MFYSLNQGDFQYRQHQKLLKEITKSINDEFQAIQYYTRLAELSPNKQCRQSILGIRQDEIKHFHWFSKAFWDLSGKYPRLILDVSLPSSFKRGVSDSKNEELKSVLFYQTIASQMTDPQLNELFLKAADDEGRHSQIFSQIESFY